MRQCSMNKRPAGPERIGRPGLILPVLRAILGALKAPRACGLSLRNVNRQEIDKIPIPPVNSGFRPLPHDSVLVKELLSRGNREAYTPKAGFAFPALTNRTPTILPARPGFALR
jgi:hypothetical protein